MNSRWYRQTLRLLCLEGLHQDAEDPEGHGWRRNAKENMLEGIALHRRKNSQSLNLSLSLCLALPSLSLSPSLPRFLSFLSLCHEGTT